MQTTKKIAAWQLALRDVVTNPIELLEMLKLDYSMMGDVQGIIKQFPLRVPRSFIARMQPGNWNDPLLRQVLPLPEEGQEVAGFSTDPLAEMGVNPVPGLLHKYYGRVLLTVTGACGVNCRYCFRRHFPYAENNPGNAGWDQAIDYIKNHASITEVILSGGDPLLATDQQLAHLAAKIASIAHVKILRIHSRMPVVLPERLTSEFIEWFTQSRLRPVLVLHCNHPQELTEELRQHLMELRSRGVTLLNQGVLLQGVNDDAAVLIALSEKLFEQGVLPYYLHILDKVQGAAHFQVSEAVARELRRQMLKILPGYLVPRLVREEPDAAYKTPV